jgi:hypothetical protein
MPIQLSLASPAAFNSITGATGIWFLSGETFPLTVCKQGDRERFSTAANSQAGRRAEAGRDLDRNYSPITTVELAQTVPDPVVRRCMMSAFRGAVVAVKPALVPFSLQSPNSFARVLPAPGAGSRVCDCIRNCTALLALLLRRRRNFTLAGCGQSQVSRKGIQIPCSVVVRSFIEFSLLVLHWRLRRYCRFLLTRRTPVRQIGRSFRQPRPRRPELIR